MWSGRAVEEANLNVQISKLRHILDQGRPQGSCIQTLTGYGYRFVADVKPCEVAALLPQAIADDMIAIPKMPRRYSLKEKRRTRPMFGPSGLLMLCSGLKPCVMAYLLLRSEFVALLAILVDLKAPWLSKPRDVPPLSLVVLPFADLSDDHKTRNLAEGIVQDVTTELSRVGQITVVAPSTASAYARKPIGVRGIGRALRVRYVLQGSVEGTGDRIPRYRTIERCRDGGDFPGRTLDGSAAVAWSVRRGHRTDRGGASPGHGQDRCRARGGSSGTTRLILRGRELNTRAGGSTPRSAAITEFGKRWRLIPFGVGTDLASPDAGVGWSGDIHASRNCARQGSRRSGLDLTEAPRRNFYASAGRGP